MALPKVGVQAVVENMPGFEAMMNKINGLVKQTGDSVTKSFGKNKGFADAGKAIDTLVDKGKEMAKSILDNIPVVGQFSDEILGLVNPSTLAVGAVVALTAAVVKLGIEGGRIKGVADSFDTITASVGQASDALLGKLREATGRTVTDFNLMRNTNIALAGATGEFGKQFGEALPRILDLARLQARATGQDVDFLVQSLISGIKRASPLLIDNTGIVLKVGEANEQLAKKLGKSVEALTAEEKQIAVLNAVLQAGEATTRAYGDAQEYANTKFARAQTTIQNMIDGVQVALEPIASSILNAVNLVLDNVAKIGAAIGTVLAPIISVISSVVNAIVNLLAPIINFIGDTVSGIFSTIGYAIETIFAPIQVLIDVFGQVGGAVIEWLLKPFSWLFDILNKAVKWIIDRARDFLKAGAVLIGGLAAGMLRAANTLVLPTVIAIATLIADFLVGHSPPPKGPLSEIDRGGAAVMESWLQGFVGVSLDPINEVAQSVTLAMGDIAKYSLEGVETRIKQLDAALYPFQDRLNIIKARFEALKPVSDAAFSSIDRQLDTAVQALATGDQRAAEQVRTLDMQRQSLQAYLDTQQEQIDKAQIQYALAQAQQAQERVLLDIRKRQLEVDQAKTPAEKAIKEKALKEAKEKAGSGTPTTTPSLGGGFALPAPDSGGGFADELKDLAGFGFDMGGGQEELAKFQQGTGMLQEQFDRIGSAPLLAGIKEKLDEFAKWFDPNNPDGVIAKALGFLAAQSDPSNTAGLVGWFVAIPDNISKAVTGLAGIAQTQIIDPLASAFADLVDPNKAGSLANKINVFFNEDGDGTLKGILAAPLAWIQDTIVTPFNTKFNDFFMSIFSFTDGNSFAGKIALFFMGNGEGSFQQLLRSPLDWFDAQVLQPIVGLFTNLATLLFDPNVQESFASKVFTFFTGTGEGTLQGALAPVGRFIADSFANPFIDAINGVIGALEKFINESVLGALKGLAKTLTDFLASIGDTGSDIVQRLNAFQGSSISIGRIAHLKQGGILGGGLFKAGEAGAEIGMSAAPFAMFSKPFTRALDKFADVMLRPTAMPMPISNTSYNSSSDQHNMTNNFYGVQQPNEVMRRIAMLRAKR